MTVPATAQTPPTRREALARHLMGCGPQWQDMPQPYEQMSSGLLARREQPEWGPRRYP